MNGFLMRMVGYIHRQSYLKPNTIEELKITLLEKKPALKRFSQLDEYVTLSWKFITTEI